MDSINKTGPWSTKRMIEIKGVFVDRIYKPKADSLPDVSYLVGSVFGDDYGRFPTLIKALNKQMEVIRGLK